MTRFGIKDFLSCKRTPDPYRIPAKVIMAPPSTRLPKDAAAFESHQTLQKGHVVMMNDDGSIGPWHSRSRKPILGIVEKSLDRRNHELTLVGIAPGPVTEFFDLGMPVRVDPSTSLPTTKFILDAPIIGVAISEQYFSFTPNVQHRLF